MKKTKNFLKINIKKLKFIIIIFNKKYFKTLLNLKNKI